jgi:hypothetical protein
VRTYRFQGLVVLWWVVFCSFPCASADSSSAIALCKKGTRALEQGGLDGALTYFTAASSAGMSKDSLYYFLSSIYFSKGAFDTALAFNFGMKPRVQKLIVRQLEQRCRIYAALGWKEEADSVTDSLMTYAAYRRAFFVPAVIANAGIDYEKWMKKEQATFPYLGPLENMSSVGPGGGGNLRLHWAVPVAGRNFSIEAEAGGSAASMYYRPVTSVDSMNLSWGGMAGIVHKKSGLSLDYSLYRVVDYDGTYSTQNSIGISRIKKGRQWLTFVSGGYGIEFLGGLAKKDQTFWITGYADQAAVTGKGFSALVNLSGYFASPVTVNNDEKFMVMYVEDIAARPVRHDSVDVQSQLPTSHPIPLNQFLFYRAYMDNSILMPASGLFGISEAGRYSRRYLSLSPQVTFRQPLPLGMVFSIGAGVSGDYYLERYRWATLNIDKSVIDTGYFTQVNGMPYYIAHNNADGQYYWVKSLDNIGSGEQYGGPITVSQYEKQRCDAECSLSLSLRRAVWKLGTFSLGVNVSKNYSTLRRERFLWWQVSGVDAPFSLPAWSYGVTLNWNFIFSAN